MGPLNRTKKDPGRRSSPPVRWCVALLCLSTLAGGVALTGCTRGSSGGNAGVPDLLMPSNEDVLAYVAVPSLDVALRNVSDLIQRVAPPGQPPQTPEALKAQLGTMLGDPQLAALDSSRPIILAVLKPTQPGPIPPVVALLPAKDAEKLAAMVAPLGLVSKADDGLVAIAQTPQALELAPKVRPLHDRFSGTPASSTARIYADSQALLASYGPVLEIGLAQMTKTFEGLPGAGASTAKVLKLEARAFLALLGQISALQVDVEVGRDWVGVHASARAKTGSELAAFFELSGAREAPTRSLLESRGGVVMSMSFDPAGTSALYKKLLDVLSADADTREFVTPDVQSLLLEIPNCVDGTASMSMGVADSGLLIAYDLGVTSEEKLLSMVESSLKMLAPGSGLGSFYKGMGLDLTAALQRGAREHGGVAVHALHMKGAASPDAPPEFQASAGQLKALLGQNVEIAVVGTRGLASSVPGELDRMIDAAQAKKQGKELSLKAREVLGVGRQVYVDYDLAALMHLAAAGMPEGEVKEGLSRMLASLSGVAPMVAAFTCEGAKGLFQLRLPVEIIVKMREAAEARGQGVAPK